MTTAWKKLPVFLAAIVFGFYGCIRAAYNIEKSIRLTPAGKATDPQLPLGHVSDEANAYQLQLARNQGKTVGKAEIKYEFQTIRPSRQVWQDNISNTADGFHDRMH